MSRVSRKKIVFEPSPLAEDAGVEPEVAEPQEVEPATESIVAAPVQPVKVEAPYIPPCGLEGAPRNSKIVVVRIDGRKRPILMTPQGEHQLIDGDVAWTLPEGAKIEKRSDSEYVAQQLDHNRGVAKLVCTTAREAISRFHQHFHG